LVTVAETEASRQENSTFLTFVYSVKV